MSWKNWGDHPIVVGIGIIGVLAGLGYTIYDHHLKQEDTSKSGVASSKPPDAVAPVPIASITSSPSPSSDPEKPHANAKSSLPSPQNTTIKESEDLQKKIEQILLEKKLRDQREAVLREEQALKANQSKILGKWIAENQDSFGILNLEFTADGELNPGRFRLFGGKHKYKFVTSKRIVTTGSVDSGGEMEILELSDQKLKLRMTSSLGTSVANYTRGRN
jgi:hypothetical protein